MDSLRFIGPYKLIGEPLVFNNIELINGIYLWCVKGDDNIFRVLYVGESQNVKKRLYDHLSNHLKGAYTGYCINSLKLNIRILMHRAGEGMIPRFTSLERASFNSDFVENMYIFYAQLPIMDDNSESKWLRCRFETGVSHQIENSGQNILSVGHLRYWKEEKVKIKIDTGQSHIEYLTDQYIEY